MTKYKHWYENKEGTYWIERRDKLISYQCNWGIYTFIKYNKKYPWLSGQKEIATFEFLKDAETFLKLKNKGKL